jgi:hypothetical protein
MLDRYFPIDPTEFGLPKKYQKEIVLEGVLEKFEKFIASDIAPNLTKQSKIDGDTLYIRVDEEIGYYIKIDFVEPYKCEDTKEQCEKEKKIYFQCWSFLDATKDGMFQLMKLQLKD